jgi:hypothetical protein
MSKLKCQTVNLLLGSGGHQEAPTTPWIPLQFTPDLMRYGNDITWRDSVVSAGTQSFISLAHKNVSP